MKGPLSRTKMRNSEEHMFNLVERVLDTERVRKI